MIGKYTIEGSGWHIYFFYRQNIQDLPFRFKYRFIVSVTSDFNTQTHWYRKSRSKYTTTLQTSHKLLKVKKFGLNLIIILIFNAYLIIYHTNVCRSYNTSLHMTCTQEVGTISTFYMLIYYYNYCFRFRTNLATIWEC